ncbi:FecR family protein [Algibacter lectus]|uniref:FecR family protein n=1 Tax=Algibacter lectus TaxID=221126 RepID=A0A4R8MMU9_9FLAO|nr:FecR domain-containing protein [Algibacter lectus]MWW26686.1 anti-sigma factor [Algibacter lectus]TDY65423.1 FecR family protein [Algibacter lectus]
MNKENDILKWFEGEMSLEDIKNKYPLEDFSNLEKMGFYSKQIEVPIIDAEQALADFKKRSFKKEETKVVPLNFKTFMKVAAVLVVLLTSSYFLFFNHTTSYSTEIAQTETLKLPDNSEVILNAQSELAFNKKEWKQNRSLTLKGEAFFKVTKGKKFTVDTDAGSIQVLGTQFNVKERDNYFEVQCYEGSVSVTHKNNKTILTPGKSVRVVNGELVEVKPFNAENPSWLAKESSFSEVPLWQVINELEVQYDIVIDASKIDAEQMFSGTFTHNDKNIALQSVTIPLKLSYAITGKNVEFYNYESN